MRQQRGVALAIVVWFIAGMSLLVAGIVAHARVDTRTTQIHLARAKAVAAGDGAITLAMFERVRGVEASSEGPMISETRHRLGELEVLVRIIPASGFVDVNSASLEILQALFHFGGGLEPGEAKTVAANVVKWRSGGQAEKTGKKSTRRSRSGQPRFYSIEDMLRVEGVTRRLLDGIRNFAVAGSWASGAMDWSASPQSMMELLGAVSPGQQDTVSRRRETMQAAGSGGSIRAGGSGVYRADAMVSYGGRTWLRRRWLRSEAAPGSTMPWRVVRTEAPRVVGRQE